jgi:hypothetical protein
MNKLFLTILFFVALQITADRIPGKDGVIDDFVKTEEYNKNKKISKDFRKKTLERNLTTAIKYTMHKKYADYKDRIKDLKPETISFEQEKGTFNYFINYRDYYFFYNFAVDPEVYVQLPQDERVYIKMLEQDTELKASAGATGSSKSTTPPANSNTTTDSSKAKPN